MSNGTLVVKKIDTRETLGTMTGHRDVVFSLTTLDDGRLVSASNDNTLKVWT